MNCGLIILFISSREGKLKFSNTLKFSSCITNAVFHHSKQSILAAATVTGILYCIIKPMYSFIQYHLFQRSNIRLQF